MHFLGTNQDYTRGGAYRILFIINSQKEVIVAQIYVDDIRPVWQCFLEVFLDLETLLSVFRAKKKAFGNISKTLLKGKKTLLVFFFLETLGRSFF